MKARLVMIDVHRLNANDLVNPPFAPYLVVAQCRGVFVTRLEWGRQLPALTLEAVTPADVHEALGLGAETTVTLSAIRVLPDDDFLSEAMVARVQQWWIEMASQWLQSQTMLKAS